MQACWKEKEERMEKKKNISEIKRITKQRNNIIHDKYSNIINQIIAEDRGATETEKIQLDNLDREFIRNQKLLLINENFIN